MENLYLKLSDISKKYDKEIIKYGVYLIVFNAISIMSILIIAYILDVFKYGVIYVFTIAFLRIKIGGYHCKKLQNCMITFGMLFCLTYLLSNKIIWFVFLKLISLLLIIIAGKFLKKESGIKLDNLLFLIFCIFTFFYCKSIFFVYVFTAILLAEVLYIIDNDI